MAKAPIELRFGFVCEFARREDNGKLFLIGVFGHNLAMARIPALLHLTAVVSTYARESNVTDTMEVQATLNGNELFKGSGTIAVNEPGPDLLVVSMPLQISEEGEFVMRARIGKGHYKTLYTLPVIRRVTDPSIET